MTCILCMFVEAGGLAGGTLEYRIHCDRVAQKGGKVSSSICGSDWAAPITTTKKTYGQSVKQTHTHTHTL